MHGARMRAALLPRSVHRVRNTATGQHGSARRGARAVPPPGPGVEPEQRATFLERYGGR